MVRLLAFDLLLLSWNDEPGKPHPRAAQGLPAGVGGALLLDAVLCESVTIENERVHVTGRAPDDPLVARLVDDVSRRRRPPKAKAVVGHHGSRRLKAVRERMVRDGVLVERDHRVLGIFPTRRQRPADPGHADALRERIRLLLTGATDPEQAPDADVILAALAGGTGAVDVLVERGERKAAKKRAESFADGHGVSEAVGVAVREAQAAALAAVAAAGAASASSSSSS